MFLVSIRQSPKGTALIPSILFIQFNIMTPTKLTKLVLVRHSLVMFRLVADILPHLLDERCTDRERPVSRLPCEIFSS